jgi:hypothetical protein
LIVAHCGVSSFFGSRDVLGAIKTASEQGVDLFRLEVRRLSGTQEYVITCGGPEGGLSEAVECAGDPLARFSEAVAASVRSNIGIVVSHRFAGRDLHDMLEALQESCQPWPPPRVCVCARSTETLNILLRHRRDTVERGMRVPYSIVALPEKSTAVLHVPDSKGVSIDEMLTDLVPGYDAMTLWEHWYFPEEEVRRAQARHMDPYSRMPGHRGGIEIWIDACKPYGLPYESAITDARLKHLVQHGADAIVVNHPKMVLEKLDKPLQDGRP